MLLAQGFIRDVVRMSVQAALIWKSDWGWRTLFQDGALTWPASWCWLLAGGQFLTIWTLCRVAPVSSWHGFSRTNDPSEQGGSGNVFYDVTLGVTDYRAHLIFLVTWGNPDTMWERPHKGMNTRRWGICDSGVSPFPRPAGIHRLPFWTVPATPGGYLGFTLFSLAASLDLVGS